MHLLYFRGQLDRKCYMTNHCENLRLGKCGDNLIKEVNMSLYQLGPVLKNYSPVD